MLIKGIILYLLVPKVIISKAYNNNVCIVAHHRQRSSLSPKPRGMPAKARALISYQAPSKSRRRPSDAACAHRYRASGVPALFVKEARRRR